MVYNRLGSNPFIDTNLDPLLEEENLIDHHGDEGTSPRDNFEFDPAHMDKFLFHNIDQVLVRVVELVDKFPLTFNHTLFTKMVTEKKKRNVLLNLLMIY